MSSDNEKLLTPAELAERWQIHIGTLANWRNKNKGPVVTVIGNQIRYALSDVVKYENENKG